MKVAVIGPICKDEIIIKGKTYSQLGGVTYYTGHALSSLGIDVTVFGSFGHEKQDWLAEFKCNNIIRIKAENTIKFINEYPEDNPDTRIQKAKIYDNQIRAEHIPDHHLNTLDYIILGPLFHDNISKDLFEKISNSKAKSILAAQGMIRYLDADKIVWKHQDYLIKILPLIDYLFLDENELEFITKKTDTYESIGFLQEKGIKNIIVTKGKQGSLIFLGDKSYNIKAFPPKELVDPTGAGDSYLAGFVKSLELFDDPLKQGDFAAMAATISIENKGPFNRTINEIYQRLGM